MEAVTCRRRSSEGTHAARGQVQAQAAGPAGVCRLVGVVAEGLGGCLWATAGPFPPPSHPAACRKLHLSTALNGSCLRLAPFCSHHESMLMSNRIWGVLPSAQGFVEVEKQPLLCVELGRRLRALAAVWHAHRLQHHHCSCR